jgi:hypothetical protein
LTYGIRNSEVDYICEVVGGYQHVGRFDVAVDEPVSVRGVEGVGDLTDEMDSTSWSEGSLVG